jgi:diketogulonate reductase-like aldo/keto reductase
VGRGIAECGVAGLQREDLFLTSKLHPRHLVGARYKANSAHPTA